MLAVVLWLIEPGILRVRIPFAVDSMTIDVFPRLRADIAELVWSDSDDLAVLLMLFVSPPDQIARHLDIFDYEAACGGELRSRVFIPHGQYVALIARTVIIYIYSADESTRCKWR